MLLRVLCSSLIYFRLLTSSTTGVRANASYCVARRALTLQYEDKAKVGGGGGVPLCFTSGFSPFARVTLNLTDERLSQMDKNWSTKMKVYGG